jgi:hypothetical protein
MGWCFGASVPMERKGGFLAKILTLNTWYSKPREKSNISESWRKTPKLIGGITANLASAIQKRRKNLITTGGKETCHVALKMLGNGPKTIQKKPPSGDVIEKIKGG